MVSALMLAALTLPGAAPPSPPVADMVLRDARGQTHRLSDQKDHPVLVLVFLAVDCPLANLYVPRIVELTRRFGARGVRFLGVDANEHDASADLIRLERRHTLPFPLVRDVGGVLADRVGATRNPEVFVLDRSRHLRYQGRIDDQYNVGGVHKPKPSRHDLAEALEDVLAARPVRVSFAPATGCPINRAERSESRSTAILYTRDVAPILQRRCQVCHRPGQSAPFSLMSHSDASGWAGAIREVLEGNRMPPWGADPRHGRFSNDPSLTPAEKRLLLAWIDAGCPEGDPDNLPPPAVFPKSWTIPGPDLILQMPKAFTVPAQGAIEYQYYSVDPGFREDRWVTAAEIMPGNRAVVHHCNIFLQPPGFENPSDVTEQGRLGSYCLTQIAPGTPPMILPPGMAKRIPPGWKIVFVMHYQAIGRETVDRTRLGLTFADPKTVQKEVATKLLFEPNLRIPPREAKHQVSMEWKAPQDVLLVSLYPHMHLRGKSFRYELVQPNGKAEILLDVPRYDFAWQLRYVLAEPRRISAGSRIRCTAVYDNSADNPANPDPNAEVHTGTQSWEEMFNGYFDVALADEDLTKGSGRSVLPFRLLVFVGGALLGTLYLCRRRLMGERTP